MYSLEHAPLSLHRPSVTGIGTHIFRFPRSLTAIFHHFCTYLVCNIVGSPQVHILAVCLLLFLCVWSSCALVHNVKHSANASVVQSPFRLDVHSHKWHFASHTDSRFAWTPVIVIMVSGLCRATGDWHWFDDSNRRDFCVDMFQSAFVVLVSFVFWCKDVDSPAVIFNLFY